MSSYQICLRCVLDSTTPEINFDSDGNCNYCDEFLNHLSQTDLHSDASHRASELTKLIGEIKLDGASKPYDCIVGVSGGVDSSWTLYNVVKLGLRPLAVHMDNGWNSELAVNNIANLIDELGVDLYTYVIEWKEYRNLMQAFFKADVIDIELLYDNAMLAVCYEQASKYHLRYILSGSNTSTEGVRMPLGWSWRDKWDARNIRLIAKWARVPISTFPTFSNRDYLKFSFVEKISWMPFLDFLPSYNKNEAFEVLSSNFGLKPYPYKHYENVFTRFYQGYILPSKFKVDKRRVHLSSLIITGQMNRDDALKQLDEIAYPTLRALQMDKDYFLKKMNWTGNQLDTYLERPPRAHDEWGTDLTRKWVWPLLSTANRWNLKRKER